MTEGCWVIYQALMLNSEAHSVTGETILKPQACQDISPPARQQTPNSKPHYHRPPPKHVINITLQSLC